MFWNVRATPAPAIAEGDSPSIRRSPSRISPASGRYTPVSRLNTVVLPAPLGPISPCSPRAGKRSENRSTALQAAERERQAGGLQGGRRRDSRRSPRGGSRRAPGPGGHGLPSGFARAIARGPRPLPAIRRHSWVSHSSLIPNSPAGRTIITTISASA